MINDKINEKLGRIIIASNYLPISISKEKLNGDSEISFDNNGNSDSLTEDIITQIKISHEPNPVESAVNSLLNKGEIQDFLWVGWPRCDVEEQEIPTFRNAIKNYSEQFHPLFLEEKDVNNYYKGYCKNCLWPLLHYQLNFVKLDPVWWESYKAVNEKFANEIVSQWKVGDFIWIHDYHLMLLPLLLRERLPPDSLIGYFFHVPFPSYELFRILPNRKELLQGVLGCNLIGFQSFEYLRHFRSSCARLLDLEVHPKGLAIFDEKSSHFIKLQVSPIGVDYSDLINTLNLPIVTQRVQKLKEIFQGKKIIIARDRLDQIEGVPRKMEIIEQMFSEHPELVGKLIFIQIYEPTVEEEDETEEQKQLHRTVNEMVGRINGRFGKLNFNPIEYINRKVGLDELTALYRMADIALITPIRDGMNLASHEYVVCQKDSYGVLILSEFTGAARCLGGGIIVNPFSKNEIMSAIMEALSMKIEDRKLKHQINYNYVMANTSSFWAKRILVDLNEINQQKEKDHKFVPRVSFKEIKQAYKSSRKKKIFLLDYDGTLTPLVRHPKLAFPSKELLNTLNKISEDPLNQVYVISGRDRLSLENWLGELPIGMSCEHGSFLRLPRSNPEDKWIDNVKSCESSWKENVLSVMQDFEDRTPGSFIEHKQVNLTWHYRNADQDFGEFQSRELIAQLQSVANKYPLDILVGKKAIEVKPFGINKGEIVKLILSQNLDTDFIICIGDDKTDEDMFKVLSNCDSSYSIKVTSDSKEPTKAKFTIEDVEQVLDLLSQLSE
ncbi:glycosyltransferase [Tieghemostelium lacteum]|uniref:Glycosyltransferase n=1 Tax=Tieghemostelium lacteum TaxID=361077 RepID=A0A152A6R3_TIELA|nr:glycosyltransferase [Tieghemostelium lacteum]|eukprot:KYR01904.1 glycosyltransferase [Tieghemostelium lacteum]